YGIYGLYGADAGQSGAGTGVRAEHSAGGVALDVHGRSRFSTCKTGTIPSGRTGLTVADTGIGATSFVALTLTGDPGATSVKWAERRAGLGFFIHLSGRTDRAIPFAY